MVRAKVDFKVLEKAKIRVRELCEKAGADLEFQKSGYPHFYYLDDKSQSKSEFATLDISGEHVEHFVQYCFSTDTGALKLGEDQACVIDQSLNPKSWTTRQSGTRPNTVLPSPKPNLAL